MAYTETTSQSWFGRMGNAFKSLVAALVLFAVGTGLLYWNEGRSVATADAISEAQREAVAMPDVEKINPDFEGKMVHATGFADTKDVLTDSFSGFTTTAINLKRQVEYYQWVESSKSETKQKLGGGTETVTTYTYAERWASNPVDSSRFRDPAYAGRNSAPITVPAETAYAQNVSFGAYRLPPFVVQSISGETPSTVNLAPDDIDALNERLFPDTYGRANVHVQGNIIYLGQTPISPRNGDVRITYTEVKPADISILAKVLKDTFEEFRASNNNTFSRVSMGNVGMENMFGDAFSANATLTWILRAVGTVVIVIALAMFMSPLSVLASVIPFLGSIVGAGTGLVAVLLGLAWSFFIIAISWLRFRPLLGGGLLVLSVALLVLLFISRKKKSA